VDAALRQQLDRLLEPHRDRAGTLVEQLVRAVDRRVEDAKAARAGREHRLEADRAVRIAELPCGCLDAGRALDAAELRRTKSETVQERVALRLVVRAANRLGRRDEDRYREAVAVRRESFEIVRRLREHDVDGLPLDDVEDRVRE